MPTATAGDVLLRDILDNPGDDGLRLIYADWLEDHGDPERAEFVRVQVELAMPGPASPYHPDRQAEQHLRWLWRFHPAVARRRAGLRRRERELLAFHAWGWSGRELPDLRGVTGEGDWTFRRGFVEEVRCPLAAWLAHGPAVVAAHPVTRVVATDRRPMDYGWDGDDRPERFGWIFSLYWDRTHPANRRMHQLPLGFKATGVASSLYPTESAALDALSAALILYAKGVAP